MHFYQKHIGDFNNATRHLTRVERSLYSDAIELYYQTEKPLTNDINKLRKLLLAVTDEEKEALDSILTEYFTGTENGYFHKRCDEEINKYQSFIDSRSKAGKTSAEKRKNTCSTRVQHKGNIKATQGQLTNNHKPITNNQEPIDTSTNVDVLAKPKKQKSQKTGLPDNFGISEDLKAWAEKNNYTRLEVHLESFIEKCKQHDYKYADWDAAFKTAIRADWAKARDKQVQPEQRKPVYFVAGEKPQANKPVNIKEILLGKG